MVLQHRAPGIGAAEPGHAHPRLGHQPVGGLVGRLHRGDDRLRPKRGRSAGSMICACRSASAGRLYRCPKAPRSRKQFGIGGVADRMDGDLEIVHRRPAHLVLELGVGEQGQAALPRRVAIIGLEPGAARAERAVEIELHPAHAQVPVIEPGRRPRPRHRQQIVDARGVGEDAHSSWPRSPARRITAQSAAVVPMSAVLVTPKESRISCARASAGRAESAAAAAPPAPSGSSHCRRRPRWDCARRARPGRPPAPEWRR